MLLQKLTSHCFEYRRIIIENGGINSLERILCETKDREVLRLGILTLVDLCQDKVHYKLVEYFWHFFVEMIMKENDPEILAGSLWGLYYLEREANLQEASTILNYVLIERILDLLRLLVICLLN